MLDLRADSAMAARPLFRAERGASEVKPVTYQTSLTPKGGVPMTAQQSYDAAMPPEVDLRMADRAADATLVIYLALRDACAEVQKMTGATASLQSIYVTPEADDVDALSGCIQLPELRTTNDSGQMFLLDIASACEAIARVCRAAAKAGGL